MPFERPTLSELETRIRSDLAARVTGSVALLRRSVLGVQAKVFAGTAHLLFGFLNFMSKQAFPDTAESEYLLRWAALFGLEKTAATFSQGNYTFTGTNGTTIASDTELQTDDGVEYTTDALGTISGGTATVAITASTEGAIGNLDAGETLTLVSPISGIDSQGTVAAGGLTGGTDEETDEALRARLLLRLQDPPHGGSAADYEIWALEVSGVTRAWVFEEWLGAGTVGVFFVRDNDGSGAAIIPSAGEVTTVQTYIDDPTRRPVTADVTVIAPTAVALNLTIELTGDDTTAIRNAVEANLEDMLLRDGEPGGTILLSRIREAISTAAGETDHDLTVPSADVTHSAGQLPIMGMITWV